jgi:hypothetical protein
MFEIDLANLSRFDNPGTGPPPDHNTRASAKRTH